MLSRVRTLSSAVELFSLRKAAFSRSGHSVRFTNSNSASPTSVATSCPRSTGAGPAIFFLLTEPHLPRDNEGISSVGVVAVSLNSCKDAATFLLIPEEVAGGRFDAPPGVEDKEDEDVDELCRVRGPPFRVCGGGWE